MKQRDESFPKNITKTKTKQYVAFCPECKEVITPPLPFRIQASQRLRYHLEKEHHIMHD